MNSRRNIGMTAFNCLVLLLVVGVLAYNVHVTSLDQQTTYTEDDQLQAENTEETAKGRHVHKRSINDSEREVQGGSVYIRWGRNTCPDNVDTELLYAGVVAGQWFEHTGGGTNHLCLPMDPVWGNYNDAAEGYAKIYGAEYEGPRDIFSKANSGNVQNHNVPCAVCLPRTRPVVYMLPARKECYPGWTLEYHGYLTTAHFGHKGRTDFACMDEAPEADEAGYRNENGDLFYTVEGACGSLPCPPYVEGRELTCAVCSK